MLYIIFPLCNEVRDPVFGVNIKIVKRCGRIAAAILDVFAKQPVQENLQIQFDVSVVFDARVGTAQLDELIESYRGQLFRREQKFVGLAKQSVIFVVLSYKFKDGIDKIHNVARFDQPRVIEKVVNQLVFVILGNAVNVVVMRIERAAAQLGTLAKLADADFAELLFFREHFGKYFFNKLSRFS